MATGNIENPMGVINGYITYKIIKGRTNQNGMLATGITTNNGIIIYAGNSTYPNVDNGYVGTPYRAGQVNAEQYVYVVNGSNGSRVANTNVRFIVLLLKYDIPENS